MKVEDIVKSNQPDIFQQMKKRNKHRNKKKRPKKDSTNYKELMEDAPVYKRSRGSFRQVR